MGIVWQGPGGVACGGMQPDGRVLFGEGWPEVLERAGILHKPYATINPIT